MKERNKNKEFLVRKELQKFTKEKLIDYILHLKEDIYQLTKDKDNLIDYILHLKEDIHQLTKNNGNSCNKQ